MNSSTQLLGFFSVMTTAFASCDYKFDIYFKHQNAPYDVCTTTKVDNFYARVIPTIISIFANPKYDLKPMKESDGKKHIPGMANHKEQKSHLYCHLWISMQNKP